MKFSLQIACCLIAQVLLAFMFCRTRNSQDIYFSYICQSTLSSHSIQLFACVVRVYDKKYECVCSSISGFSISIFRYELCLLPLAEVHFAFLTIFSPNSLCLCSFLTAGGRGLPYFYLIAFFSIFF